MNYPALNFDHWKQVHCLQLDKNEDVVPPESPIGTLPAELLQKIFMYLPNIKDLASCEQTCRWFYENVDDSTLNLRTAQQYGKIVTLYPGITKGEIKWQFSLLKQKPFNSFPKELLGPLGGVSKVAALPVFEHPCLEDFVQYRHKKSSFVSRPASLSETLPYFDGLALSLPAAMTHSVMWGESEFMGAFLAVKFQTEMDLASSEETKHMFLFYDDHCSVSHEIYHSYIHSSYTIRQTSLGPTIIRNLSKFGLFEEMEKFFQQPFFLNPTCALNHT